ncbi:hypothetical protein CDL15_Pgr004039 [Punica granatum]|uniref:Uncharacterized protein n=1 Tax=Punica granatum TaxID=22663 RepID=A0A218XFT4_PUNGR|nr:hypothetical protein CDL15_Pgr004039 [Punica granatum]
MDAGDSSGRRRCFAVVDRDLTGAKSVGIGAVIAVFRRRFPKSPISKFSETRANCLILLPGSCSSLAEFHFCLFNCNFFPVFVEISADLEKIAENRDLGVVPGQRGSRAADSEPVDLPNICAVTEETTPGAYIRLAQENEELNNWTSVPRYSAVIVYV